MRAVISRWRALRVLCFTFLICAVGIVPAAYGQDNWKGGAGLWSDGTKWTAGVPTSTSNAYIDHGLAGASSVTLNFNGAQCADLTIDGDDKLTVADTAIFTVFGPTIANAGTLFMDAVSGSAIMDINGSVTLTGTGGLTMSNNANNALMGYGQPNGATLTNKTTIQGAGSITAPGGGGSFINQGTVNANQTNALTINGSNGVTNTGTLEATNGATLVLNGGTITNTTGTIHADPSSVVTLPNATISGGTLSTSGSGTIQANCCLSYSTLNGVTLTSGSTFQLNSNNIGYFQGTITDNGSMQLNAPSGTNVDLDMVGAVTLTGSGTLTSNNSNNSIMGYGQTAPGASLTNQITIEGAGQIAGIGSGNTFTNSSVGKINANQSVDPFTITVGGTAVFNNAGLMEATNGGTLALNGGPITNNGGTIHADPASTVTLYNTTISGGTLTTSGTGKFQAICCLGYSTLDGVTVNGAFQWVSNNIGYLQGTVTNNGPMTVNAPSGTNVDLDVNGAVTLKGSGTLTSTNSNNAIMGYGQSNGSSLLNQSKIQGTWTISATQSANTITNQGTILANKAGGLTIATGNGGTFTNTGTLSVSKGIGMNITGGGFTNFAGSTLMGGKYMVTGTLAFDGASITNNAAGITLAGTTAMITNQSSVNALPNFAMNMSAGSFTVTGGQQFTTTLSGNFSNAGKVMVGKNSLFKVACNVSFSCPYAQSGGMTTVDGTLTDTFGVNINGGKLFGTGTISASVVSKASVTAGDTAVKAGILSPNTYTQNSAGTLNIQIGGTTVGTQYSQLAVANGASLNGTLNVKLINSFVPAIGDVYTILTSSARSGTFSTVHLPVLSGAHFVVGYTATSVTLTVVSG